MSSQFLKKAIPIPSNYLPFSTTKSSKTNPSLFFISKNSPIEKLTNKFAHPTTNPIPLFVQNGVIYNSTPPEFPKKPDYDPSSVPQEMPEIPREPEIETSPGYIPPEVVPEMPWPTPTPRPPPTEIPVPPPDMPSTPPPTGPKLPPDPDILPPQIDPIPETPPDIREPSGPGPNIF